MAQLQVVEVDLETSHRPLSRWILRFLHYLDQIEEKSANTLRHYAHDLDLFSRFLQAHAPWITKPGDVTSETIVDFLTYMRIHRGNSPSSNRRRLVTIRRFFAYLLRNGEVYENPAASISVERGRPQPTPVLTRLEARRLLEAAKTTQFPTRDYAIFRLFLSCGCTLSELISLTVDDYDPFEETITFRSPSGLKRRIYLSPACSDAIRAYLRERPKAPADKSLFLNRRHQGITKGAVYHALRHALRRAGINRPGISVHSLRRTCLTLLWGDGISLYALQQVAGFSSLATTKEYAGFELAEPRADYPTPVKWKDPFEE